MRIGHVLLASSLLLLTSGCRRNTPTFVSGTGWSATAGSIPVGPVPGTHPQEMHFQTNPLAGDPVALQDGRRLFDWYNCSGCHGGHAGGGMGPSLRDRVWIYGDRDDQIFDSIAQGRANGMPSWGSKIPEIQIWELVAYIRSMRTPQEPDPPIEPSNEMVPDPYHETPLGIGMQTKESTANAEEHK